MKKIIIATILTLVVAGFKPTEIKEKNGNVARHYTRERESRENSRERSKEGRESGGSDHSSGGPTHERTTRSRTRHGGW